MQFYRDASNRLTAWIDVDVASYNHLVARVVDRFGLSAASDRLVGFDEAFRDFRLGELLVGLEWDIWSGFQVVAKSPQSEPLVERIAQFLTT